MSRQIPHDNLVVNSSAVSGEALSLAINRLAAEITSQADDMRVGGRNEAISHAIVLKLMELQRDAIENYGALLIEQAVELVDLMTAWSRVRRRSAPAAATLGRQPIIASPV